MIATPPPPGPARPFSFPTPVEATLDNGLRVVAVAQHNLPLIAAHLVLTAGATSDPPACPGLAAMTATLLTQGAAGLGATEIAERIDALGARLDAAAGSDASTVSVIATTTKFRAALELAASVVREPTFAQDDVERIKAKAQSDLKLTYGSPSSLARLVATRVAYGDSPYAHPLAGTPQSLDALTRDDVVAFHCRHYVPSNALLVIGGDLAVDEAIALAREVFASWPNVAGAMTEVVETPLPRPRCIVVDHPPAGRTAIVTAQPAIRRDAPEYYAGVVATAILSGYSGRLNQEVRVKRGLSYGASAQLIARRRGGLLVAGTLVDHRKALEATDVVLATLRGLVETPPAAKELATRKTNVLGTYARSVETIEGLINAFGEYALYGLPLDEIERFQRAVEATQADAIVGFARRYVAPEPAIVLVGHADEFADELARRRPVERIPFDELDLGSAKLR